MVNKNKQMNIRLSPDKEEYLKAHGLYGVNCVDYAIRRHKSENLTVRELELELKISKLQRENEVMEDRIYSNVLHIKELKSELEYIKKIPDSVVHDIEKAMDMLYASFCETSDVGSDLGTFFEWKHSDIGVIAMDFNMGIDEVKDIYEKFYYSDDMSVGVVGQEFVENI